MCTKWFLRASRLFVAAALFIVPMLVAGCGESGSDTTPKSPADAKAQQEAERAAREAAFGKGGVPKPPAASGGSGAGKNSSKG